MKPELRFKGFEDEWEKRQLSEILKIQGGFAWKSNEYESSGKYLVVTISNVNGDTYINDSIGNFINCQNPNQYLLKRNDILVSLTGNVGRVSKMTDIKAVLNQRVGRIFPVLTDSEFIFQVLKDSKFEKAMIYSAQGAAQKNISNQDILNYETVVSKSLEEQQKIGSFFSLLLNKIDKEKEKLNSFKVLKQSLLDKMFPQKGSDVPELRLDGFTEPWEKKMIGEIAEIVGGGTPSSTNPDYWDGDITWFAPAEIEGIRFAASSERNISKEGLSHSSARLLPADKTVLFTSRAGIGKTAILKCSACTNQGFQSMVLKNNIDPYFVYTLTPFIKDQAENIGAGSTFKEVSGKMLATIELAIPSYEEQKAIGEVFKDLDDSIDKQKQKLSHLETLKSAFLERMFV